MVWVAKDLRRGMTSGATSSYNTRTPDKGSDTSAPRPAAAEPCVLPASSHGAHVLKQCGDGAHGRHAESEEADEPNTVTSR